jgi:RimJ/RimL family protein N-acetyltransferase
LASLRKAYWRVKSYYRRYGAKHTLKRFVDSFRRKIYYSRDVIYSMDLVDWPHRNSKSRDGYSVERFDNAAQIPEAFLKSVGELQSAEMFKDYLNRRLERGASLWCCKKEKEYLGYFWVFIGRTMKPHYIPLSARDVHIFDGYIFPENRGHGEMAVMMDLVIDRLKTLGLRRAYIETAEWNAASRKFIEKMGYSKIGYAKQRCRRGKNVVTWWVEPQGTDPAGREQ